MSFKRYLNYFLLSLAITVAFYAVLRTFKDHLPDSLTIYRYTISVGVNLFVFFSILYRKLYPLKKYYLIPVLTSVALFFCLGIVLNKITLKSDKHITFNAEMKVVKNDMFQLFYIGTDGGVSEERSYQKPVSGSLQKQIISIDLPDTIQIKRFRFDLGSDSTLKHIEVDKIYISYNDQTLELLNAKKAINYFKPNEYVTVDKHNITLTPINGIYDPFISTKDFGLEYAQLFANKKHLPFAFIVSFFFTFSILIYFLFFSKPVEFKVGFYTFASCVFILMLFLPSINETFHFYEDQNTEKRKLAVKPVFEPANVLEYPKQYETYYNDNFGFRDALIQLGGKLKYYLFNTSAVPQKVEVGKKGWLFLNGSFYHITQDITKSNSYKGTELQETVNLWENRKTDLEKEGIMYYKAFWPDKHYIYPEFLPLTMQVLNKDTLPKCDQALNYLRQKKSSLTIIDVREILLKEKEKHTLYAKHDSHWNEYGAFIAYTELMNNMSVKFPSLQPHPLTDFTITWKEDLSGDLSKILGVSLPEQLPTFTLKHNSIKSDQLPADGYPENTLIFENKQLSNNLTLLIFRDSYTDAMIKFLNLHFKKIVLIPVAYSNEIVKKAKPDIVLECYVTRYF